MNEKLETLTSEYNSTVTRIDKEKQLEDILNLMTETISCLRNKIEGCDENQKNLDRQLVYEENRLSDIKSCSALIYRFLYTVIDIMSKQITERT